MKLIPLTKGLFAQVDDADYEYLSQWNWCAIKARNTYYAVRYTKENKKIRMHRVLLDIMLQPNLVSDHIDMNGLNNQRSNLRIATCQQNSCNYVGRGNSQYRGVRFDKKNKTKKWRVAICRNRKPVLTASFNTEIEAAIWYNENVRSIHGEFARLNEIKKPS